MFTVYIIYATEFNKTYVGQTKDLDNRLLEHNETGTKGYTIPYRPWVLVHSERYDTRAEAMKREKYLKTGVGREFVQKKIVDFLQL